MRRLDFPFLGFGVGLRREHYTHVCENRPAVDWFEVISENTTRTTCCRCHIQTRWCVTSRAESVRCRKLSSARFCLRTSPVI
ncbi:MAG: DUF692 family multinuclear iron-containing protein [Candidatus Binataceae bacterium]